MPILLYALNPPSPQSYTKTHTKATLFPLPLAAKLTQNPVVPATTVTGPIPTVKGLDCPTPFPLPSRVRPMAEPVITDSTTNITILIDKTISGTNKMINN